MSGVPPIKKGWMKKLGRKGMIKNWKKRFFVLNAGVITYYEKEINEFPFGDSLKVKGFQYLLYYCVKI